MKIAVLGAGAWGTALAISLGARHDVALWTRDAAQRDRLRAARQSLYLPGCVLPASVAIADTLAEAAIAELVIITTSTEGLRSVAVPLGALPSRPVLWACKGFEEGTNALPHEVIAEALPQWPSTGALSGPSFALEVARDLPTALVLASADFAFAAELAARLNSPRLRIYSSGDLRGVELGGAVKNVIAIAAGISDGLELGRNARAALVTRGLAEMVRLGTVMGGQAETFMGLAGLGDLVLTCTGDLSRNRAVGMQLARGMSLEQVLRELGHVAEGVRSAAAVREMSRRHGIEMPITDAVCCVLFEGVCPMAAVERLLMRDPRPE